MSREQLDLILTLEDSSNRKSWIKAAARKLSILTDDIDDIRILKRSIDARQQQIKVQLRVEVSTEGPLPNHLPVLPKPSCLSSEAKQIIIVGSGPGGLFAALKCLQLGCKPIIIERGKEVSKRRFDLAPILRKGSVIEDSNYCFGEGGAGTFSDGKLYTRAKKRGPVHEVYRTFVAHGAPEDILIDAHPHIGSNLLPNVIKSIRHYILESGGEFHFNTRINRLIWDAEHRCIRGVGEQNGREFIGKATILATGHSARDIYHLLQKEGLTLEQKTFAVGVRIEHPQALIDQAQYHLSPGQKRSSLLPAASYRLAKTFGQRGVHSFCMCPGGFIVPAATQNDEVVVNGMSLSRRDSPLANSGFVVTVTPEDTAYLNQEHGVLAGIRFQKSLEIAASLAGGGMQKAPAQRVVDFLKNKESSTLPKTSYHPGINSAPLHELLPSFISEAMKNGLEAFNHSLPGFISDDANLIGVETRTSSPVRIPRHPETLAHIDVPNLYPCGEGAGYAGGIVSAALDGMRCAEAAC